MKTVAVIGSGIAGLAAAYLLSRKHRVWLFEKDSRLGGHTHTVHIDDPRNGRTLALDTGFIVHNDRTYPNLVKLFDELNLERLDSDMSFGVSCRSTGFEYSSRGFSGFFADRRNLARIRHLQLLGEIVRFNRTARRLLAGAEADRWTIGDYLDAQRFSGEFIDRYLYPMTSAIWSAAFDSIRSFPASTMVRFLDNHGMLTLGRHPTWKVLSSGSSTYIPLLTRPLADRIVMRATIRRVVRAEDGVTIECAGRPDLQADEVVFACHGDQVLPLLDRPTDLERDLFASFSTTRNDTWLHTDASFIPARANARASWNYELGENTAAPPTVTYHLNRLQRLTAAADYCVTLNPQREIAPSSVIRHLVYEHPLYTKATVAAQARWREISGRSRTHFCGAYWYYGFHEDGLRSAVRVARDFGVEWGLV